MEYLLSFLVTVTANVIGYYICKWLDRNNDENS